MDWARSAPLAFILSDTDGAANLGGYMRKSRKNFAMWLALGAGAFYFLKWRKVQAARAAAAGTSIANAVGNSVMSH